MFDSIGADPELFLRDISGKTISAIGRFGGTKEKPQKVPKLGKGYAYQEDNVLLEYNIPPVSSLEHFSTSNYAMQTHLAELALKQNLILHYSASEIMPDDQLADPRAHVFGCEPDYNAWKLEINPRPVSPDPALRSAGGHIHFGFQNTNAFAVRFVRMLDAYCGLYSVLHDPDTRRRQLYGKAGAMRRKKYGVEYRVLSNFWTGNREHQKFLWSLAKQAYRSAENTSGFDPSVTYATEIQTAINTSDKALAKRVHEKLV